MILREFRPPPFVIHLDLDRKALIEKSPGTNAEKSISDPPSSLESSIIVPFVLDTYVNPIQSPLKRKRFSYSTLIAISPSTTLTNLCQEISKVLRIDLLEAIPGLQWEIPSIKALGMV